MHEDAKRKNIPTAEYESVMAKEDQTPIELAYERRNRDLDPQLVWRGKDRQDWHDLVVETKGYRGEDAKQKKDTMDTFWGPGVNNLGSHGRWAFAEFTDIYEMQDDFKEEVAGKFEAMIEAKTAQSVN